MTGDVLRDVPLANIDAHVDAVFEELSGGKKEEKEKSKRGGSRLQQLNDEALANLDAWVPQLFPDAQQNREGWRVTSATLRRDLQEDLSFTPEGIKDFGVHDMGDPREGGRTPIDVVMEWHLQVPIEKIAKGEVGDQLSVAAAWLWKALGHADDWKDDDPLNEMNERFAVVMIGGKARVLTWEASPFDQCWKIPIYLPRNDFRFLQDKWRVIYVDAEGETQKVPRGSWWLSHPARRQYDSVVFVPGKKVPGKLNLWNGWACEPRPGDCGLYLAHLKDNICSGDDGYYQYLLSWMAYAVQQPARQGEVAVVLRGGEGTGKGFAVKRFGRLFGPHFLPVTNTRHLTGNFNVHLQQCCVLFGDEAFYAGDRQHEGILKVLVTEESLTIEPKGIDIFLVPNYLHVVLSSNNEWVVPASFDARRWFVLDVSDAQKQNTDYFGKIDDQMLAGGQEALLHLLMTRDIGKFDVRDVPKTGALAKQKEMTRRSLDRVIEKVAHEGVLPCAHREYLDVAMTSGEGDGQDFYSAARRIAPDLKHMSSITMARVLKEEWECEVLEEQRPTRHPLPGARKVARAVRQEVRRPNLGRGNDGLGALRLGRGCWRGRFLMGFRR